MSPLFSPVSTTPIDSLAIRATDTSTSYWATGMGTDSSGNIYTLGYNDLSSENDGLLTKYDSAGTVLWKKKLNSSSTNTIVYANDLVVDSSGNSYVFGSVRFTSTISYGLVVKIDNTGATTWSRHIPFNDSRGVTGGTVDASGNVYAVMSNGAGGADYSVLKWNSSGTEQFSKNINYASGLVFYDVAVDSTGNVYLAGTHGGNYCALVKLNSTGVLQWAKHYYITGATTGAYYGVAIDSADGIYAVGTAYQTSTQSVGVIVKYNTSGVIQWQRRTGLTTETTTVASMRRVAVDTSNNVYVIGYYNLEMSSNGIFAGLSKYNSSGTLQWSRCAITSKAVQQNWSWGVTADASQNVYFSFSSSFSSGSTPGWHVKIPTATSKVGSVLVSSDALTIGYFPGLNDTAASGTTPSDVTMTVSAGPTSAATTTFLNQSGTHTPVAVAF